MQGTAALDRIPQDAQRQRDRAVLETLRVAAQRYRPSWLTTDAEDIAHRAYEKLRVRLDAGEPLSASYLRRVAYTVCIDVVRSERAEQRRRADWGHPPEGRPNTPEHAVAAAEVAEHISTCIAELPTARRQVAVLYLQGHGASEIAGLLDEPYKRIENLLWRSLAALRKCLQGKGVTPP